MAKKSKEAIPTTRNYDFSFLHDIARKVLTALARIGDAVLFVFKKLWQSGKTAFSIARKMWKQFLHLADITSDYLWKFSKDLRNLSIYTWKASLLKFELMKRSLKDISAHKIKFIKNRARENRRNTVRQLYESYVSIKRQIASRILATKQRLQLIPPVQKSVKSSPTQELKRKKRKILVKQAARFEFPGIINMWPAIKWPVFKMPEIRFFGIPRILIGFCLGIAVTTVFVFIPYNIYLFLKLLPNPRALSTRSIPVTTQVFDRNGTVLYEIYQDEDRKPIQLASIPDTVKNATIAIEDKQFYQHPGISLIGIARATRETLFNQQLQGGSTITQQLIKNSLLTSEVTFKRKFMEILLAFWAERVYTKNQILEMYLNQVPYGGTAWGIEAAAETYFGKKVQDLTLAEAAYLSGLPAAPTFYSPYGTNPQLAKSRQEEVLHSMYEQNYITREQEESAKKTTLVIKPQINNIKAAHFVMYVRQYLTGIYGERTVDQGGLRITTSLDLPLQEKVQDIVSNNIRDLAKLRVGNGAAIITQANTGEILSMVGSKDYFNEKDNGNVNVVLAPRQPGSSIKPLTYAAALEKGMTPATWIDDSQVAYPIPGQPTYAPVNYDGRFHGVVTLRSALANSYNIPAVKTLNRIGVKTLIDVGRQMGISTWTDESRFGLSLTLGGGEVTLFDMATAYGVFANKGEKIALDPILKITDYTGRVYYERGTPQHERVITPETAFIISSILSDNQARSPAFGPSSSLVVPGSTVAVKTGTTNEKRDNWTVGYTPTYVTGVWVGNNDNSPMDPYLTSGITGAAPIWNAIMTELLKDKPVENFSEPGNLEKISCYGRTEYFVKGTEPKGGCPPLPSPRPTPTANPT